MISAHTDFIENSENSQIFQKVHKSYLSFSDEFLVFQMMIRKQYDIIQSSMRFSQ
jgi:hypothetical protein